MSVSEGECSEPEWSELWERSWAGMGLSVPALWGLGLGCTLSLPTPALASVTPLHSLPVRSSPFLLMPRSLTLFARSP